METQSVIPPPVADPAPTAAEASSRLWRAVVFPVKFYFGMVFCQSMLASLMVVGWSYRFAQRAAFKHWWKRSAHREGGGTFTEFLGANEASAGQVDWPNWFIEQNFLSLFSAPTDGNWGGRLWDIFRGLTAGLRRNLVLGIQGAFNVFLLTLPAGLMWWFGWDYGWNISFYKGYEQSLIGTGVFLIGSLLFVGVMFYLPLAQARQAVTGDWRAFWSVGPVIRILRAQWIWVLLFSGLFALLCVPVLVLKTAPPYLSEPLHIETLEQAIAFIKKFSFGTALYVLPAYVLLRVLAAKIYAHGILRAVQEGSLALTELSPGERAVLQRLDLHESKQPELHTWFWKIARWMGSRLGQFFSAAVLFWVWLALVASIVATEFLAYHEAGRAWWNQQLIGLPWFDYLPTHIVRDHPELGLNSVTTQVLIVLLAAPLIMAVRYGYEFVVDLIRKRRLPD